MSEVCLNPPELLDSRRLTGANLYWDRPSAILDVQLDDRDRDIVRLWRNAALELLAACGMADQQTRQRLHHGGASLLVSAPIDALYSMCELNELAWAQARHESGFGAPPDLESEIPRLRGLFEAERRPRLLALQQAAHQRGIPFLWDDDEVSVGYGAGCQCWPHEAIPDPEQISWPAAGSIPLGLVTGTNGKSTSVRMVAAILKAAGLRGGLTSTDFIRVGDEIIDEGDYSGTGGARRLLRHPQVEAAVLEVARGGLLRRGLAVERANAALITNVAADHLGEYGINTVAELVEAKFIVHRALDEASPLVLNADDAGIVGHERYLREQVAGTSWWFSLDAGNPRLASARQQGATVCWLENDGLWLADATGAEPRLLTPAGNVSASLGGVLRHNLQNAMGAALLALAMGMPEIAVRQGLQAFRGDERDNPGRGNWFEHNGVRIVVDFAHNAHGLDALAAAVAALQPGRVIMMLGQAGDRSDESIRETVHSALAMRPEILLVNALPGYERGRGLDDVPRLIHAEALACGLREDQLRLLPEPLAAAREALREARAGDVLVLLALTQRREILQMVHEYCGSRGQ